MKQNPEFSREREFKVILEDLQSQFRVFGEGLNDVRNRVERIEDKVDRLDQKVDILDGRVSNLENEMSFVRRVLPTVATKDDLLRFEKRLIAVEKTRS